MIDLFKKVYKAEQKVEASNNFYKALIPLIKYF